MTAEGVDTLHVLAKAEGMPTALAGLGPYTQRGSTPHFTVYYDNSLGPNGQNLADAVLAKCESDYTQLISWFGGVVPGGLPFTIYIDPGSFGAYHANCAATELHLAAFGGTNGDLVNMVDVAEADEVMMAAQNKGWNCGASAGEGLSRVLATERYPAQLDGFASAASWLDGGRPDWVNNTEPTDQNYVSIGCAVLFINYLVYQLGLNLYLVVQAGGTTLAQTYANLTGSPDALGPFAALLQQRFPPGTPSGLTTDNPYPLAQGDWRWCHKCQGLFFGGNPGSVCPAGGAHDATGSGNYALATQGGASGQNDWRWCHKCQGLFFGGNPGPVCPAGGAHDATGSGNYVLVDNVAGFPGQHNWRWCHKCQGMFFGGHPASVCPAGGTHDATGSGDYVVMDDDPGFPGQHSWRWCHKCQGMFFGGNPGPVCPAGGAHDAAGSGDYVLVQG